MPLRLISKPRPAQSPLALEEPIIILARPGSIRPRQRVTQALVAGSLLAVAFRPPPRAAASAHLVTNLNPSGAGSLPQAVDDANANPGPDTISFQSGLSGTITLTSQINISGSVQIIGPGPGVLAVSGNNLTRVFYLTATSALTATISGLTIRDGFSLHDGAGILADGAQLTLDHVAIISNTTPDTLFHTEGGGVDIENGATISAGLTIRDSLISGNHAYNGGGVYTAYVSRGLVIQNTQIVSNTAVHNGGGAYIDDPIGNTLIEDSTILQNTAGHHGGGIEFYQSFGGTQVLRRSTISGNRAVRAGGLYIGNLDDRLVVENSTVSGNHASSIGGGIVLYNNLARVSIQNSTVFSNSADVGAGGIEVEYGVAPITNTIIAGNVAPTNNDISGTFTLGYDLVQLAGTASITDAGGNLFGLDPLLGPLADNGGPTLTHSPKPGSPVINAGDPAFAAPPSSDQRSFSRVVGGRIDMGAVETNLAELFLPVVRR